MRNGFCRYFKVGNFILEGLLFWRHFWQFFPLNNCVPTSHNMFSGMTPAKVKLFSEIFVASIHVYKQLTQISKGKRMLWTISYSQKTWCKPLLSSKMKRLYQRKWRRNWYDSYCTNWTFAQSLTRHQHSIIPKSLWESR